MKIVFYDHIFRYFKHCTIASYYVHIPLDCLLEDGVITGAVGSEVLRGDVGREEAGDVGSEEGWSRLMHLDGLVVDLLGIFSIASR